MHDMTDSFVINLFINSDAILNRDALWSIQGKKILFTSRYHWRNTPYIQKYCDKRFLVTMGYVNQFSKHFMPSVCTCDILNF